MPDMALMMHAAATPPHEEAAMPAASAMTAIFAMLIFRAKRRHCYDTPLLMPMLVRAPRLR